MFITTVTSEYIREEAFNLWGGQDDPVAVRNLAFAEILATVKDAFVSVPDFMANVAWGHVHFDETPSLMFYLFGKVTRLPIVHPERIEDWLKCLWRLAEKAEVLIQYRMFVTKPHVRFRHGATYNISKAELVIIGLHIDALVAREIHTQIEKRFHEEEVRKRLARQEKQHALREAKKEKGRSARLQKLRRSEKAVTSSLQQAAIDTLKKYDKSTSDEVAQIEAIEKNYKHYVRKPKVQPPPLVEGEYEEPEYDVRRIDNEARFLTFRSDVSVKRQIMKDGYIPSLQLA